MTAGLESSYLKVVPRCLMHPNACGIHHGGSSRKRFAIFSSEDQRHNFLLPAHDQMNKLAILVVTPMTNNDLEALRDFLFGQFYQTFILRAKLFRHLLSGEMPVGHAMIDSTRHVVIEAHLQNLSRQVARLNFGNHGKGSRARAARVAAGSEDDSENYCEHDRCCGSEQPRRSEFEVEPVRSADIASNPVRQCLGRLHVQDDAFQLSLDSRAVLDRSGTVLTIPEMLEHFKISLNHQLVAQVRVQIRTYPFALAVFELDNLHALLSSRLIP